MVDFLCFSILRRRDTPKPTVFFNFHCISGLEPRNLKFPRKSGRQEPWRFINKFLLKDCKNRPDPDFQVFGTENCGFPLCFQQNGAAMPQNHCFSLIFIEFRSWTVPVLSQTFYVVIASCRRCFMYRGLCSRRFM